MRTLMTLLGTVVFGGLVHAQSAVEIPDEPLVRIQVVDEQGQPIRTARVPVRVIPEEYCANTLGCQTVCKSGIVPLRTNGFACIVSDSC